MTMNKIRVMDVNLANQIAAGEVIERPASVIKELVENSIDAHAKVIQIKANNAGRTYISVEDDGDGMDRDDASKAFLRHATSKIYDEFDLFRIKTLGFRGEALASIAAISHVKMITSTGKVVGSEITIHADQMTIIDAPLRQGTMIEVSELFYNTPARLKYLKSDYTETSAIIDAVSRLALAHTEISFTLMIDDKLRLKTSGRANLHEAVMNIYGVFSAKNLIEFKLETNDFNVKGYLGKAELARSNRYGIITNLNGRNVYMPKVQNAIISAYHDFLPDTRYPFVILDFSVEPGLVDVNVHPSKREVRFSKENDLIELLVRSIPNALLEQDLVFDPNPMKYQEPEVVARTYVEQTSLDLTPHSRAETQDLPILPMNDSASPQQIERPIIEAKKAQHMVAVAQLNLTYVMAEDGEGGFYLIDQHAAAERINYERFQTQLNLSLKVKAPLIPLVLDYSLAEASAFDNEKLAALKSVGITLEPFGNSSFRVVEVPLWTEEYDERIYVTNIIEQLLASGSIDQEQVRTNAIATMACKASIKANMRLSHIEQQHLIDQLFVCNNPYNCPHGRPTIIHFNKYQLEKMFKRTGVWFILLLVKLQVENPI